MRLEDYCNRTSRGNALKFTAGIITTEEECFGIENGWRVASYAIEYSVTGWDALLDMAYAEYVEQHND